MHDLFGPILGASTPSEDGFTAFDFGCSPSFEVRDRHPSLSSVAEKTRRNVNDETWEIGVMCLPGIGRISLRRVHDGPATATIVHTWALFMAFNRAYRIRCAEEQLTFPLKLSVHVGSLNHTESWISAVRLSVKSPPKPLIKVCAIHLGDHGARFSP
jgi:hypothetical protein